MFELYIANKNYSSWSLRPWLLMRELGIPFSEHLIPFPDGSSKETFLKFAPNAKVPCLHDDAQVIWDSLGIIEHLAERHQGVWPAYAVARSWARCASAEMHSGFQALRQYCTMNCGIRVALHSKPQALQDDIKRIWTLWAEGLARFGGPYLAGDKFSAVDAMYAPVVFRMQSYGIAPDAAVAGYVERMLARPAMQDWYQSALRETWREPAHEEEARQAGTWLQDLREA